MWIYCTVLDNNEELLLLRQFSVVVKWLSWYFFGTFLLTWCFLNHSAKSYVFRDSKFMILISSFFLAVMAMLKLGEEGVHSSSEVTLLRDSWNS